MGINSKLPRITTVSNGRLTVEVLSVPSLPGSIDASLIMDGISKGFNPILPTETTEQTLVRRIDDYNKRLSATEIPEQPEVINEPEANPKLIGFDELNHFMMLRRIYGTSMARRLVKREISN